MTCGYRSPCALPGNGPIFGRKPDYWLCGCPAGEHALGRRCINNQDRCKVARLYDRVGGTSINYSQKNQNGSPSRHRKKERTENANVHSD